MLQYHNITPAHFFAPYDPQMFRLASLGRQELATLAGHVDLALGDSDYNRQELEALGFAPTGVFPIFVDTDRITKAPRRPALEKVLDDGLTNFLFVGRIAPNKKIEDHIRLAEVYKRYVDTNYRFIFVGKSDAVPNYYATIRAMMVQYQMPADRFWFTGPVPNDDLAAFYRCVVRVHLAQRARGVLRAAASRRWPPTCRCWRTRPGGAGDARRRRRAVLAEGSRIRGGTARRDRVRPAAATTTDRGQRERRKVFGDARLLAALDGMLGHFA